MSGFSKKLISILLIAGLVLSLTACGGKGGNGGGSDSGSTGSSDNITSSGDVATIFILNADTIGVYLNTPQCEKLMPKGEHEESEDRMTLHSGDWNLQISFSSFYASISYKIDDDNWGNVGSGYEMAYVSNDEYLVMFTDPGLAARFEGISEWKLTAYSVNDSEEKEIASMGNIVKDVAMKDYADLMAKVRNAEALKGDWAGTYTTDGYGDYIGSIVVEVTEHNALYIKVNMEGLDEMEFIALEEVQGDEPDYFFADAKILNQSEGGFHVNIQYSRRDWGDGEIEHGLSFNTDDYSDSSSSSYKSASLEKFMPWFVKPDGYIDEDPNGTFARKDPKDDEYFKPDTDDYIIYAPAYPYTRAGVEATRYSLYSFDINGHEVDYKHKFIFASEADAKKFYDDCKQYPSRGAIYHLEGNILYELIEHSDDYYPNILAENKIDVIGQCVYYQLYFDCHYLYKMLDDGSLDSAVYVSKPYSSEDINIGAEDSGYYKLATMKTFEGSFNINGTHPTLSVYVSNYQVGIFFGGPIDNDYTYMENPGEIRISGRNIVGTQVKNVYDYNTESYTLYIFFTEIELNDTGANATQYGYKLSNPNDTSINFDTYKNYTPDITRTQEYTMQNN